MSPLIKNSDRDLFEILVAVAWIDGQLQDEEKSLLTKIAAEHNFELTEDFLSNRSNSSTDKCYELLQRYLGKKPSSDDYQNLLCAVSRLIYSDNNIANTEAELLTQIQNLDPQEKASVSTFDKLIAKIQKIYQKGVQNS